MRKAIFITTLFLTSCGFANKTKVTGNYYLVAADANEQMSFCFHTPEDGSNYGDIVGSCVYAVGFNEKYIISKQHPTDLMHSNRLDKSITNYFIVPIEKDIYTPNNKPLNQFQFEQQRKRLGIENIEFTIEYKSLE